MEDLKAERNAAIAALQELHDAGESYAKAALTLSNAESNFSNHDAEAKAHLSAMVRVSNAEKAARALLSNYATPANQKSLLRAPIKPGEWLVCYCPPGVCQAPKGFSGPCNRAPTGMETDQPTKK